MTTAQYTRRILSIYRACTNEEHEEGMRWYKEAYAFAASLDSDVERAAAVIAILSPMTSWPQNVDKARRAYAGDRTRLGFTANRDKVSRILDDGEDWRNVMSGPKVIPFFNNIMGNSVPVTIDRHAIDIAIGRPLSDKERSVWMGKRNRAILSQAYTNAAKRAGVTPSQMQAITWVHWRKHYAQAFHG